MSFDVAWELPESHPAPERRSARSLHAVGDAKPARRPRLLYGVIAVGGVLAIGAAQMGLSILTAQTSYEIADLTTQQRELGWQKQILQDDVAGYASPQYLAANAAAMGMVTGGVPNHLRLSDGAVSGVGQPADSLSAVDALGKAAVTNALVAGVPLVTDPEASIATGAVVDAAVANITTPPPISDGLPTPATH